MFVKNLATIVYDAFQLREFYSIKTKAWEIEISNYNF